MNDIDGSLAELDKDQPLREDIRLLGRLLGDTLREQEGDSTFELIEQIRQLAIRFRRDGDEQARSELAGVLDVLSPAASVAVIRAFTYFSQLANIAEDLDHNRRRRQRQLTGSPAQEGSLALALARGRRGRPRRRGGRGVLPRCADVAGAHRPPDRGATQEHPRLPAAHRAPAHRARPPGAHAGGARRQRGGVAAPDPDHVADPHPARAAPDRARRDRERAVLLSLHLPAPAAAAVRRDRGSAGPQVSRRRDHGRTGAAAGCVDRRRPRRQPLCHPRRDAASAGPPVVHRAGLLPR